MQKNFSDFSVEDARRLAETPAGQQLLSTLEHSDNGQMAQAAQHIMAGDTEAAKKLLMDLLRDPSIASLLQQLGG